MAITPNSGRTKNFLWWANTHTSVFNGNSLNCAYVSELTTPSADYRHQCLQHFAHRRAINQPTAINRPMRIAAHNPGHAP